METVTLTDQTPAFTITGREEKMSAEILKATILKGQNLTLQIIDENDFLLFTKKLQPEPVHPNAVWAPPFPEIAINKRFIFDAALTILIQNPEEETFSVTVQYV